MQTDEMTGGVKIPELVKQLGLDVGRTLRPPWWVSRT